MRISVCGTEHFRSAKRASSTTSTRHMTLDTGSGSSFLLLYCPRLHNAPVPCAPACPGKVVQASGCILRSSLHSHAPDRTRTSWCRPGMPYPGTRSQRDTSWQSIPGSVYHRLRASETEVVYVLRGSLLSGFRTARGFPATRSSYGSMLPAHWGIDARLSWRSTWCRNKARLCGRFLADPAVSLHSVHYRVSCFPWI